MLRSIHLQGFKRFKDVEVALAPYTVLMGSNSSGKTSILQAINFSLQGLYDLYIREADKKRAVQLADKSKNYYIDELPYLNISRVGEFYYGGKASPQKHAYIVLKDSPDDIYNLQISSIYNINSPFGNFHFKCLSFSNGANDSPMALHRSQPLLISGFAGLSPEEERRYPQIIRNRVQTGRMSDIIRNIILDIKGKAKGNRYELFTEILDRYFQFHINSIEFDEERDNYITASFSEMRDQECISLNLNASGNGLLQILQILAPIYRFASKGTVVLLDEPDAHLHTNLQHTLGRALREVQRELDIQVIISTHSIPMIETAQPYEVVPVYTRTQHLEPLVDRSNVDLAISELIDNYHLARAKIYKKLSYVEDANTQILERFDIVLGTKCFPGVNGNPGSSRGRDSREPFLAKEILKKYIGQDIQIHFVIDGDGMNGYWRDAINTYALKNGVTLHQLIRHDIESYLLNPALFLRTLQGIHSGKNIPDMQDIEAEMLQIMKKTISLSDYGFERKIRGHIYESALLTGDSKYRNQQQAESAAIMIREEYEKLDTFDQLVKVAIGKKTLKAVLNWLCSEKKLNISLDDILRYVTPEDIPEEIKAILEQIRLED